MASRSIDEVLDQELFGSEMAAEESTSLIDQYTLFVETADIVIGRRLEWNKFFISANVLFVTLLVGFASGSPIAEVEPSLLIAASLLGVAACAYWYTILLFYQALSDAKFEIIYRMESHLPVRMIEAEGAATQLLFRTTIAHRLIGSKPVRRLLDTTAARSLLGTRAGARYRGFDLMEQSLPTVFALLYVLLFVFAGGPGIAARLIGVS